MAEAPPPPAPLASTPPAPPPEAVHASVKEALADLPPHLQPLAMHVWTHSVDPTTKAPRLNVVPTSAGKPVIMTTTPIAAGTVMFQAVMRDLDAVVPVVSHLSDSASLAIPMLVAMSLHPRNDAPLWQCLNPAPGTTVTRFGALHGIPAAEGTMSLLIDEQVAQVSVFFKAVAHARGWDSYQPVLAGADGGPSAVVTHKPPGKDAKTTRDALDVSLRDQDTPAHRRITRNVVLTPVATAVPRTFDPEAVIAGGIELRVAEAWLRAADDAARKGAPPPPVPGFTKEDTLAAPTLVTAYRALAERIASKTVAVLPNTYVDVLFLPEVEKAPTGCAPGAPTALGPPAPAEYVRSRKQYSVVVRLVARRHIDAGTTLVRDNPVAPTVDSKDTALNAHQATLDAVLAVSERTCLRVVADAAADVVARTVPAPEDGNVASADNARAVKAALHDARVGLSAKLTLRMHTPPFVGQLPPTAEALMCTAMSTRDVMHIRPSDDTKTGLVLAQGLVVAKLTGSVLTHLVALARWLAACCRVDDAAWATRHDLWRNLELLATHRPNVTHPDAVRALQERVTRIMAATAPDAPPDVIADALDATPKPTPWDNAPSVTAAKTMYFDAASKNFLKVCGIHVLDFSVDGGAGASNKPQWNVTVAHLDDLGRGETTPAARERIMLLAVGGTPP